MNQHHILNQYSVSARDTINDQNGNNYWEPGETIELLPLIKNYWGPTDDVRVGIEFAEFEDTSKATIIQDEIQIGSISAYASLQDLEETLKITISEGVANNVDIKFNIKAWSGPNQENISNILEFVLNVKNSIIFFGIVNEDMTLTADKEYLVTQNLIISENAILTIEPGTTLKISDDAQISIIDDAKILANGLNNNRIKIIPEDNYWSGINFNSNLISEFSYVEFKGLAPFGFFPGNFAYFFEQGSKNVSITDCLIFDIYVTGLFRHVVGSSSVTFKRNNIIESYISMYSMWPFYASDWESNMTNNNIINNRYFFNGYTVHGTYYGLAVSDNTSYDKLNIFSNFPASTMHQSERDIVWGDKPIAYTSQVSNGGTSAPQKSYLGTSSEDLYRYSARDALNYNLASGLIDFSEIANIPHEGAHGIVWKVLVNGFDSQDEYALIDPVGVGEHEFKVYFNRAMDTSINPQVSYGVTIPYNQKIISEEGTWSEDGKIYTVNHEIRIGAADGINRIRVQDAQDLDYFKIPVEDTI